MADQQAQDEELQQIEIFKVKKLIQ